MQMTIGLPGGKSLENGLRELFSDAGITLASTARLDTVQFPDYLPLREGIFLKPNRIPLAVAAGLCNLGITGEDAVREHGADVQILSRLGFGRATSGETRGVLFCAASDPIDRAEDIPHSATVLSEYPRLTRQFLDALGKTGVGVEPASGTCETEVPRRYRFGVVLSETGRSLRENGLKAVATVFSSATCLVANKSSLAVPEKRRAIDDLQALLLGVLTARGKVLLSMNVPSSALAQVVRSLPALGSPTIAPLADGGSSVSAVMSKQEMNRLVPRLQDIGVTGIIAMPIMSVIP